MIPTRGERNNNPGNIDRTPVNWQGLNPDQSSDDRFCVFLSPKDGIRALAKVLINYQVLHHLNTVQDIIERWAPGTENNTAAYVQAVCAGTGLHDDCRISLHDLDILSALTTAIIRHENGRVIYTTADILSACMAAIGA